MKGVSWSRYSQVPGGEEGNGQRTQRWALEEGTVASSLSVLSANAKEGLAASRVALSGPRLV